MKIAYFDCAYGAAGDMLVGSLIAAGVPQDKWLEELSKIALPSGSFTIEIEDVKRCTIASKKVHVICLEEQQSRAEQHGGKHGHAHAHKHRHIDEHGREYEHEHEHQHRHEHEHSHAHEDEHGHEHTHEHMHEHHDHKHPHGNGHTHSHHGRNLPTILQIIEQSGISAHAKSIATAIFKRLGEAEARVHGVTVEEIHFHEVGAIDAIVDILGFAIAYDMLGIERSYVSPLPVGCGRVKTEHGLFPIPAPAVVNLLSEANLEIASSPFKHECLTPTGAAILATVCTESRTMPSMRIANSGYGAGTFDPEGFPNVCRSIIGTTEQSVADAQPNSNFAAETVCVLETNLDDISPQVLGFAVEQLFDAGALDVTITPVVMKKGRSGHVLTVVCAPERRVELQQLILTHTSSLGVRGYFCERLIAEREFKQVVVEGHNIRIKIARDRNGRLINAHPEFEDCRVLANSAGLPLKEVIARALATLEWDS